MSILLYHSIKLTNVANCFVDFLNLMWFKVMPIAGSTCMVDIRTTINKKK